jgi:hypothetical protein
VPILREAVQKKINSVPGIAFTRDSLAGRVALTERLPLWSQALATTGDNDDRLSYIDIKIS